MRDTDTEVWSFNRREAAEIAGVTEAQIANWQNRHNLFPEKRQGTGFHAFFMLRDLLALAAVKSLIDADMTPESACDAIRPYGVYGTLLHESSPNRQYPGTFFLTKNEEGRWVGVDSPNSIVCFEIRTWPLLDAIWPRFEAAILANPGKADPEAVATAVAGFKAKLDGLRRERYGKEG